MEAKREQAEYEYNQLYQLNNSTKHVSWRSRSETRDYDDYETTSCSPRRNSLSTYERKGVPVMKKTTYTVVPLKTKTTYTKVRKTSGTGSTTVRKTSTTSSRRSSTSGSPYEKILIPYHL